MNPHYYSQNTHNPHTWVVNLILLVLTLFSITSYSEINTTEVAIEEVSQQSVNEPLSEATENTSTDTIFIEPTPEPSFFKKRSNSFYEDFKIQQEQTLQKTRQAADQNQQNVSERLHQFSSYVDKFFADESYLQESTDSRMRISIANEYQQYETPTFRPRMSLSLALPNTQNRWRVRFQSDDEDAGDDNSDTSLIDSVENTSYSTAISRVLRESELIDVRADVGIKFRTPIDPFTKFRIRRSFLFDKVELRLTETFQWRDSQGKTAASTLDIEYPFTLNYFFRSHSEAIYWDINSYWSGVQTFTFFDQLNSKSIIAYAIGVNVQNEDELFLRKKDQVNEYWIEVRYRKNFYQDWLFYQISPGLIRPREYEFETLPRLELKLEMLYGRV